MNFMVTAGQKHCPPAEVYRGHFYIHEVLPGEGDRR